MQVSVGDYVVYPAQGVGRITAMEQRSVAGHCLDFALIRVLDTEMDVLVPLSKLGDVGLRPVMVLADAVAVLGVFDRPMPDSAGVSWIRRSRDYEARLSSGCAGKVAGVLRDLYVMKWRGSLSFGQLRLFERSRRLVVNELSVALDDPPDRVERTIVARIRAANSD